MGLEEVDGPRGARKERISKLMGSMWCRKVRIGHSKPEIIQTKKVRGWWQAHESQGRGIRKLGRENPKKLSKSS